MSFRIRQRCKIDGCFSGSHTHWTIVAVGEDRRRPSTYSERCYLRVMFQKRELLSRSVFGIMFSCFMTARSNCSVRCRESATGADGWSVESHERAIKWLLCVTSFCLCRFWSPSRFEACSLMLVWWGCLVASSNRCQSITADYVACHVAY